MTPPNDLKHPIKKAVIPAAGWGTRLEPLTRTIPKELLPVLDKPLIDYVIEEAVGAGISEIIVVIRNGKEAIAEHLGGASTGPGEVNNHASAVSGPGNSADASNQPFIAFVYQQEQKGLGHAVACARPWVGDEPFAVMLADNITTAPQENVTTQLATAFRETGSPIIALETVSPDKTGSYGIADVCGEETEKILTISNLVEKPAPQEAPSCYAIASRYVLTPNVFAYLAQTPFGKKNEIQLTDAIRLMLAEHHVNGVAFEGARYDIGNRTDYIRTVLAFAEKEAG